jgi:hypothetical protein
MSPPLSGEHTQPARREAIPLREDGLQIDEHRRFQERFWVAERAAWVAFGLVLVAALLGLGGGGGLLSRSEFALPGARIDLPAVSRWTAPDHLNVQFQPGDQSRILTFGPEFGDAFEIRSIQPQPREAATTADGLRLEFATGSDEPAAVFLRLQARAVGRFRYRLAVDGEAPEAVSTLILP